MKKIKIEIERGREIKEIKMRTRFVTMYREVEISLTESKVMELGKNRRDN